MAKNRVLTTPPNEKYVKEVVTDYDVLSIRCDEFDLVKKNTEVQNIILTLKNTIRANPGMLGLSANQVGYDRRIIVLNFNNDLRTFINPIITRVDGFELSRETCHSIPGKTFIRTRNSRVWVTYQTPLAKIESVELNGVAAKVMQHHIDHLDGLLLSDVSLEIGPEFDEATEAEREEVIRMYLDSLDITAAELQSEAESDEDGKKLADAMRFIESVQKGETIVESMPLTDEEFDNLKEKVKVEIEELEKEVESNAE
jgi:peptide deformylase